MSYTAVQQETTVASTKFISTGTGEKWMDPRDMWELKTTGLGDFFCEE